MYYDLKFALYTVPYILKVICALQDCLMGLLKEKTILYVTHQVEFLPAADLILVNRFIVIFLSIKLDRYGNNISL